MAQRWAIIVAMSLLLLSAAAARPLTIGELRGSAALDRVQLGTGKHRLGFVCTRCMLQVNIKCAPCPLLTRGHFKHALSIDISCVNSLYAKILFSMLIPTSQCFCRRQSPCGCCPDAPGVDRVSGGLRGVFSFRLELGVCRRLGRRWSATCLSLAVTVAAAPASPAASPAVARSSARDSVKQRSGCSLGVRHESSTPIHTPTAPAPAFARAAVAAPRAGSVRASAVCVRRCCCCRGQRSS